uniref:Leucine rich immune protein (Coil-less) n=1 Tax=Anopheles farauti TaxID=69004 RepID=A0A182Q1L8_9DIPT
MGTINMTSDGGAKLRRMFETETNILAISVHKLIVGISPSGPFLQKLAAYVDMVTYDTYREPVFNVPNGNTILEVLMIQAPALRAVVAGTKSLLESFSVSRCLLDRLPPTLANLARLTDLVIKRCKLFVLRLDMVAANRELYRLDLSYNEIRQVFPMASSSGNKLSIAELILASNQLEHLDMTLFESMPRLANLYLANNRITHCFATTPLTFANLKNIIINSNKIVQLDIANLTLPNLQYLNLFVNALKQLPSLPNSLPALEFLALGENNLTKLDLSYLRPYQKLAWVSFNKNQITTVRATSPVRLPVLNEISLSNNKINSLNITRCYFPTFKWLSLQNNELTIVPPVPYLSPNTTISLEVALLAVWIMCHTGPVPCSAQCREYGLLVCRLDVINMTSDGGAKLRTTIDGLDDNIMGITIDKLVVSASGASGPFLQRISAYTTAISYVVYRDPVFQIPNGNTIEEMDIVGVGALRAIVVGSNSRLKRLQVENCRLDRIPPTLGNMADLEELAIMRCALTALRLDMLLANLKLVSVDLSQNQIRQILPATSSPRQNSAIIYLSFVGNLLERLDMATFATLPDLERLDVRGNRIVRFEVTAPVTYASLKRLDLAANGISYFDARNLTMPSLVSMYMDKNALADIPTQWGTLPALRNLGFEENNLKRVDLSAFRTLPALTSLYFTNNQIESIRTSSPVALAKLADITLDYNVVTSVNFIGCDFPQFDYLSVVGNKLTAIPPLFQRFPNVRLTLNSNPIRCPSMTTFRNRIVQGQIYVTIGSKQSDCVTTSSIELDPTTRACCNA